MAYGQYKALEIANNPKYDGYQRGRASLIYKFFDKISTGSGMKSMSDWRLANELHKTIIRKFKSWGVYPSFKHNVWGADLADIELIVKYSKGIRYFLCAMDLLSNEINHGLFL